MTRKKTSVLVLVILLLLAVVACNVGRYIVTCCKVDDDGSVTDDCWKRYANDCVCKAGWSCEGCVDTHGEE